MRLAGVEHCEYDMVHLSVQAGSKGGVHEA